MAESLQRQRHEAEIKQKNAETDAALAKTVAMVHQTEEIGIDSLVTLQAQGQQLERIDKNLHEAEQDLKKSKYVLKGMKSWTASLNQWMFGKAPAREEYTPMEDDRVYQTSRQQRHKGQKKLEIDESEVTVCEGWLAKKGQGGFSGWKKRFCTLKLNGDFMYYEEADKRSCKGQAKFPDRVAIHLIKEEPEQFHITDNSGRVWEFQAESVEEREQWCAAIKQPQAFIEVKELSANPPAQVEYDAQLDVLLQGVKRLGNIAQDQQTELNHHEAVLGRLDDRIDRVDEQGRAQNKTINKLIR